MTEICAKADRMYNKFNKVVHIMNEAARYVHDEDLMGRMEKSFAGMKDSMEQMYAFLRQHITRKNNLPLEPCNFLEFRRPSNVQRIYITRPEPENIPDFAMAIKMAEGEEI